MPPRKITAALVPAAAAAAASASVSASVSASTSTPEVVVKAGKASASADAAAPPDAAVEAEEILAALASLATALRDITAKAKAHIKTVARLKRQKEGGRRRKPSVVQEGGAPRKLSGFAKPTLLSTHLCDFLGLKPETELARTEVTRLITKYVKDNGLYGSQSKRDIIPDEKLQNLLNVKEGDKLTYFNLQTHIKHHFLKPALAVPVPVS